MTSRELFHESVMASLNRKNTDNSDKTPSWLQEENQATVLGSEMDDNDNHNTDHDHSSHCQQTVSAATTSKRSSSLFGAVMQKIGSSIGNTFPRASDVSESTNQHPSTPKAARRTSNHTNDATGAMNSLLTASPSGKTIMDIVNRFNSPFRFQSPKAAAKRRQRPVTSPASSSSIQPQDDENAFSTPSPTTRKRRRLDMNGNNPFAFDHDAYSNSSSSFFQHSNEASALSHASDVSVNNWREVPITTTYVNQDDDMSTSNDQIEILDWSLPARLKIELYANGPFECHNSILGSGGKDALTYWEFRASSKQPQSCSSQVQEQADWSTAAAAAANHTKSIDLLKFGRRASFGSIGASLAAASSRLSILEGSKQASMTAAPSMMSNAAPSNATKTATIDNSELAKKLIQSVRGPFAKLSRKRVADGCVHTFGLQTNAPSDSQDQRQWQEALQSLFQNYRNKIAAVQASRQPRDDHQVTTVVLQNYFYCLGKDHTALFRVMCNKETGGTLVPAVLVTKTSEGFRERLQSRGADNVQILETFKEQQTRENSMAASNRKLFSRDEKPSNALLSPSVNADLEALRRAHAFGESAGADVFVKIKKQRQNSVQPRRQLLKPIRMVGWDSVSIFFEEYLNTFGRNMAPFPLAEELHQGFPVLVCSSSTGQFDHASLRRSRILPAPSETAIDGTNETGSPEQISAISFEVCGLILPCTLRKLFVAGRSLLQEDGANRSSCVKNPRDKQTPGNASPKHDSSRYIVLQSIQSHYSNKPRSQTIDVTQESIVFNQGAVSDSDDGIFECPVGKSLSMCVWDISRQEVAACKFEEAMAGLE